MADAVLPGHAEDEDEDRFCRACGHRLGEPEPPRSTRRCTACGRVAYRDPKVGVGVVVHDDAGRLLLVRRGVDPGKGLWALPAGFCDAGEDPRSAAARETREETGLVVAVGRLLDAYPAGGRTSFFLAFAAQVVGGTLAAGDDAEEAGWFAADALPELAFASTRAAAASADGT